MFLKKIEPALWELGDNDGGTWNAFHLSAQIGPGICPSNLEYLNEKEAVFRLLNILASFTPVRSPGSMVPF